MFGHKIKLDNDLYEKLKKCADAAGYSSAAEFAVHVLEKEKETGGPGLHRVRACCLQGAAPGRDYDRIPRTTDPTV
jgi:hypothetical protein